MVAGLALALTGCGWFDDEVAGTPEPGKPDSTPYPAAETEEADLPDPVPLAIEQRTERGVTVELTGLTFTATSVEVDVTITNASPYTIRISDIDLVDDQGNAYRWVLPEDDNRIRLEDGEVTEGILSFEGRIADGVETLELEINPAYADRADEGGASGLPYLLFEDIPLDDDAEDEEAVLPDPVSLAIEQRTERGVTVELTGLTFTATSVEVDVTITNASPYTIRISDIDLVDDQGNAYRWVLPEDDNRIRLEDGEVTEATLSFGPRIADGVETLELEINPAYADRADEGGASGLPYLLFEDIPLDDEAPEGASTQNEDAGNDG